jgi:hypothetical protein
MFTDPIVLNQGGTLGAVSGGTSKSLARSGNDEDSATYRLVDGAVTYTLTLSHAFAKRNRFVARLQADGLVSDPLLTGQSKPESKTVTFTGDWSALHTTSEEASLAHMLLSFLTAPNLLRLAAGET